MMVEGMMESGLIIKRKEKGCLYGVMVGNMKVNILMIKNMGKEFSHGLMVGSMMDSGLMVNRLGQDYIIVLMGKLEEGFGMMDKELDGQKIMNSDLDCIRFWYMFISESINK